MKKSASSAAPTHSLSPSARRQQLKGPGAAAGRHRRKSSPNPMANEPEQRTTNERKEQTPQTDPGSKASYDAIALAAYFIALDRHARGEAPDPRKDWLEGERQLKMKGL